MKSEQKFFLKTLTTLILVGILGFLIKADFNRIQKVLKGYSLWHLLKVEQQKVKNKAMLITINHYRPDLSQWKSFFVHNTLPQKSFLNDSVQYYEAISGYFPQMTQAHYMLGLCYYFLGETPSALASLQKAVVLEPQFFWAWYDLGLIYYRQKEFEQSAESFRRALRVSAAKTVEIIESSRIFNEILRSVGLADIVNAQNLQKGYIDAALLLKASVSRLKGQAVDIDDAQMHFKIY